MNPVLGIKILDNYRGLEEPHYKHADDSGFDLRAAIPGNLALYPGEIGMVRTGLAFDIPDGFELQIRSRSGLASQGLVVANAPGTVDRGYTGEVEVALALLDGDRAPVVIRRGDRIAQAVLAPVARPDLVHIERIGRTDRGAAGFGSTGVT